MGLWWNWIGQEVSRLWRWKQEVLNKWLQLMMHCVQRDSPELLERACFPSQKANTCVICQISKQGVGEEAEAEAGRSTTASKAVRAPGSHIESNNHIYFQFLLLAFL